MLQRHCKPLLHAAIEIDVPTLSQWSPLLQKVLPYSLESIHLYITAEKPDDWNLPVDYRRSSRLSVVL
jgi:hypothetical protein